MIALLCPSRGRPEQLKRMIKSAQATARGEIEIFVAVIEADKEAHIKNGLNMRCMELPDNMPTAHKWNLLADWAMEATDCKLFMLAADDMIFQTPLWDEALTNHYKALDKKQHVYALQDSRDEFGFPHVIVTREYIESMNYFVPPIFVHWYVDTWTVQIARANNCFTHLRDFLLVHKKPSDAGQGDSTHNRIREWGWNARDKYVWEKSQAYLEFDKRRLAECLSK